MIHGVASALGLLVVISVIVFFFLWVFGFTKRYIDGLHDQAIKKGYPSWWAYLRAIPRNDEEKIHAADMTIKGAILCLVGLMLFPLLIVGAFYLYYGGRKMLMLKVVEKTGWKPSDVNEPNTKSATETGAIVGHKPIDAEFKPADASESDRNPSG